MVSHETIIERPLMHFVTRFGKEKRSMKKLNGKDLFFMAMGSCIGAGIITNTGVAIGMAGSGVILAYLLAFFVMFMVFTRPPILGLPQMDIATMSATVFPVPVVPHKCSTNGSTLSGSRSTEAKLAAIIMRRGIFLRRFLQSAFQTPKSPFCATFRKITS